MGRQAATRIDQQRGPNSMIARRSLLAAGVAAGAAAGIAALARPALAAPGNQRVAEVRAASGPGPCSTRSRPRAWVTRNHAALVFDTLYGVDAQLQPQPQMAQGHTVEEDGKLWRISLRPGLRFHDGSPVLARDCVASIRRWASREAYAQTMMSYVDELSAPSDTEIRFRLKRPFASLAYVLGKPNPNVCFIMPERLASQSGLQAVTEMVGSGPYRFVAAERVPGVARRLQPLRRLRAAARGRAELHRRTQNRAFRADRVAHHPRRRHGRGGPAAGRGGLVGPAGDRLPAAAQAGTAIFARRFWTHSASCR